MSCSKSLARLGLSLCCLFLTASAVRAADGSKTAIGKRIEDFELADFHGRKWRLDEFKERPVLLVAFLGAECPLVKLYAPRLEEVRKKYADRGVAVIGINANCQDSITEMAHFARTSGLEFPLLKDVGNVVADRFGAQRTPEVFVLDADRTVRYHGRIDDQYTYGIQRPKSTQDYLEPAIESLLAGRAIETEETEVVGCHIGRVLDPDESSEVTYARQISRLLQRRCVECHREGEIAPFALTKYEEVVGWAEMIDEVVREQRMPPWHANPEYGKFANDARLTDDEKDLIHRWVAAGAPRGDVREAPPPREFTTGWRIGEPDQVVYMADKPFQVPATGEVKYQYFVVDPGWTEDRWIQRAECRPGNRAVVHHILVDARGGGDRENVHGLKSDWITATAPGAAPLILPDGYAKFVPAGSRLLFQMHYTPNGTPQQDRSCVGFVFADPAKVKHVVATDKAANGKFRIPPHAENHEVEADYTFGRDSLLMHLFPHMHLRGKSFRYTAVYQDGRQEVLLDVPHYDFNWQHGYALVKPKLMPAGTRIHCVAHFDNSEQNLANPDPTKTIRWGDQTWEEMMIGYFDIAATEEIDAVKNDQERGK